MTEETKKICPACGRQMIRVGNDLECTNIQCDYEEDNEEETENEDNQRQ